MNRQEKREYILRTNKRMNDPKLSLSEKLTILYDILENLKLEVQQLEEQRSGKNNQS